MPADLLFEIGVEELPSWYVDQGRAALAALTAERLAGARLGHGAVRAYATPRRLAVLVEGVDDASERRTERRRGPAVEVAFGADGSPSRAAAGFAASQGVDPRELVVEETDKGAYVFAVREVGGEPAAELLPELLASLVTDLPAPRKMRWGEGDVAFVRPVAWLVALLGDRVLPVEAAGLASGRATRGHRFLAPGETGIPCPGDYVEALRAAEVLADPEERRAATLRAASEAASEAGLEVVSDPALSAEVASLVEKPFAVIGSFDDAFLELPEEVLTTVMIHHQRYFPARRPDGSLAPAFVAISNNRVPEPAVLRSGFEQVLLGRLHDARFFWNADRRKTLSQHAWGLSGIRFQKDLGTMADKVARVGDAARRIAALAGLAPDEAAALEQALPIFRADLVTEMVYELPELEGTMAKRYAVAEGMPGGVAQVLEDGVLPKGPESPLPTTRAGAVLSIADRLDKIVGFFAVGKRPSGSADPFGLRRDANAVARILNAQGWNVAPSELIAAAAEGYAGGRVEAGPEVRSAVEDFLWDRVAPLLAEEGIAVRSVRAAVADRPPVLTGARRAHLLRSLQEADGFSDLLALYKRAANLADKAPASAEPKPGLFSVPQEAPLHAALPEARKGIEALLAAVRRTLTPWDLGRGPARALTGLDAAVAQVLVLKAPLDAFLDDVLVMVDDEAVRSNRLALLREVRDALRDLGRLEELEGAA